MKWVEDFGFHEALSLLVIYDSFVHSDGILALLRSRFPEVPPASGGSESAIWCVGVGIGIPGRSSTMIASMAAATKGHADLVVALGTDEIEVIGGNVGNSVTRRPLPLNSDGFPVGGEHGGETLFAIIEYRLR